MLQNVVEPVEGYPFQVGGEDPAQHGVASEIDHHLVLILIEVLDWVALIRIAIKGWNHKLLEKFIFQYGIGEGRIGCINGDSLAFTVVRHTHFLNLFLYKLVDTSVLRRD